MHPTAGCAERAREFLQFQVGILRGLQRLPEHPSDDEICAHITRSASKLQDMLDETPEDPDASRLQDEVLTLLSETSNLVEFSTSLADGIRRCGVLEREAAEAPYSEDRVVNSRGLTDSDPDDVRAACAKLWALDEYRLRPGIDYEINLQGASRGYSSDAASDPLFSFISDEVWERPTYAKFYKLLDNYKAETGYEERVSSEETEEERDFLATMVETPCMQFAYHWLKDNGHACVDGKRDFARMLSDIWFRLYRRDGQRDSSAFEHVFAGEVDDGKVKGMHSFLQLYKEEVAGNFNYKGYLLPRDRKKAMTTPSDQTHLLTIRFDWLGETKAASGVLFGVSPEFEIALYTMLFVAGNQDNIVELGPYRANVKVYRMGDKLGSAFPEVLAPSEEEKNDDAVLAIQSAFRGRSSCVATSTRKEEDGELEAKITKLIEVGGQLGKVFGLF